MTYDEAYKIAKMHSDLPVLITGPHGPTADTVYDIRFWAGSNAPSTHNTMQIFPQLADKASGLRV